MSIFKKYFLCFQQKKIQKCECKNILMHIYFTHIKVAYFIYLYVSFYFMFFCFLKIVKNIF
jgi:hypothetical protein